MKLGTIARKSFGGIVAVALTTGVCAFGQTRSVPVGRRTKKRAGLRKSRPKSALPLDQRGFGSGSATPRDAKIVPTQSEATPLDRSTAPCEICAGRRP
jgi:hypothetical protein